MWRQAASAEGFVVPPLSKSRRAADVAGTTDVGARSANARPRFTDRLRARLLQRRLGPLIREGALRVRLPGAVVVELGDGSPSAVQVGIADARWCWRIAVNPGLGLGEAYVDGSLVVENGTLAELVDLIGRNAKYRRTKGSTALSRWWFDRRLQANARRASRQNVAHHYNLSSAFFRRFLGEDLQYSCAYFSRPDLELEAAQNAKKDHLAAKLLLRPGQSVLDIGCGWGGLALSLAETSDVRVDGATLSTEQLAIATERAKQRGLTPRVRFSLTDYRDAEGPYDRIVSVGMFEHVGRPNFTTYFQQIARLLNEDGVAVIHFIGRPEGPGFTQAWIAKYIFPGGYIPALSETISSIESAGLIVTDVEVLRLHYAETLRCWRQAFEEHRGEIADLYDERFCRMWEFYLCISESAFRRFDHSVFQIQLAKRIDVVPITRDYISAAECKALPKQRSEHRGRGFVSNARRANSTGSAMGCASDSPTRSEYMEGGTGRSERPLRVESGHWPHVRKRPLSRLSRAPPALKPMPSPKLRPPAGSTRWRRRPSTSRSWPDANRDSRR